MEGGTLIGENLHLEIGGINIGLFGRTINGNWTLDIPLEYKDLGRVYEINKEFEHEGGIAKLEKIHYSPLDIRMYFTSEDGVLKDVSLKDFHEDHYVDIKLKDGNYIPPFFVMRALFQRHYSVEFAAGINVRSPCVAFFAARVSL